MIKVSVIIPTYGQPVFLDKAIKSVLSQTLDDIELIVVDDNNPDTEARIQTENVIFSFSNDKRLIYIKHQKNMNGATARNTGIAKAKGKYIAFLDSDDEYLPLRLEKCYTLMETSDDTVAGVYTGCEFKKSGKTYYVYSEVNPGNYLVETLACTFAFCTGSNIFVKKDIVNELNGFDETFLRHQDYEFLVRVFETYSLMAIPEVLVIKNNELFNLPNLDKMIEIKKQYLGKFSNTIDRLSDADKQYIYKSQYLQLAELAQKSKNKRVANEYYKKANSIQKLTFNEWLRRIAFLLGVSR